MPRHSCPPDALRTPGRQAVAPVEATVAIVKAVVLVEIGLLLLPTGFVPDEPRCAAAFEDHIVNRAEFAGAAMRSGTLPDDLVAELHDAEEQVEQPLQVVACGWVIEGTSSLST